MASEPQEPRKDTLADGTLILDQPVDLPAVLDAVIVGGGPFGTAAAFRAKELGLAALVIDLDDLMRRIRDYAKDKKILPDFGGGDRMQFPKGGGLVAELQFGPIDKDEMCARWKGLYRRFNVPAQVGVEMTGLKRDGDVWSVQVYNHNTKREWSLSARHVILGPGRGVPRQLEVSGDLTGLAFALSDAARFVGQPACVFGGGTSAAEAVIAISSAKARADDSSAVYWSYRGDKMPKVSKALADVFFEAFMTGNIRYLPKSEPVAVIGAGPDACVSVRTSRMEPPGLPAETTQLEFRKPFCLACIGEDIPERLLTSIGVPLVTGGPLNKKRIVVSPILETRQPNVYLAGDVLSPVYFQTPDFDADPGGFQEIKRQGNIKAAMRDGVVAADVVSQKLAGRTRIVVEIADAPAPGPASPPSPPIPTAADAPPPAAVAAPAAPLSTNCVLVNVLPSGIDADEYRIKRHGVTTIGRDGADISFPADVSISPRHASIVHTDGSCRVRDEGGAGGVYVQLAPNRLLTLDGRTVVNAGNQWLVLNDPQAPDTLLQYDASGQAVGQYQIQDGTSIVGRDAPNMTIAPGDRTLSRRHLAIVRKDGRLAIRDLGGANGTSVKVSAPLLLAHGDRIRIGQQLMLRFADERQTARPSRRITFATMGGVQRQPSGPVAPAAAGPSILCKNLNGADRTLACRKGDTVSHAVKDAGFEVDAGGCHQGICGLDPIRIVSGSQHLSAITDTETNTLEDLCALDPKQHRLACTARVNGPVVIEVVKTA